MKVKIITDSAADFSRGELEEYGVDEIELPVGFDGDEKPVRDGKSFWKRLIAGEVAHTAMPSPAVFTEKFSKAEAQGFSVVCILISSKLSGTYECARIAASGAGLENTLVFDSRGASAAEKLLVLEACKLRDEGLCAEGICARLENFVPKIRLFACVDTLKYLARGGRISNAAANIGTLINLKPLITVEGGKVVPCGKAIGLRAAAAKIIGEVKKCAVSDRHAPIPIYSYDDENCRAFIAKAAAAGLNFDPARLTPIGATIGTHIGPYGFGIAFTVK